MAKKKATKKPASMTVSELLEGPRGVPLWVRFWLEKYAGGVEHVLEPNGSDDDPATQAIARLVYDVLNNDSPRWAARVDEDNPLPQFPHEARDFVEEWLYRISYSDPIAQVWNNPDLAVGALPILLDTGGGARDADVDAVHVMLRTAISALTTKRERRDFLNSTDEADAEDEGESAANWHAAWKLSRVLADPRTPEETRGKLIDGLHEFSMSARVDVTHPALVRRAFQLMCDQRPKGNVRECGRDRKALLDLLDSISEEKGNES